MTQKDGSPEASEGPYWSEELLAVLVVGLGTTARCAALSHPPHSLCSGRPGALAERPGQTSSRGESVASSLARLAGEQPK